MNEHDALNEANRILAGEHDARAEELEDAIDEVIAYLIAAAATGTYSRTALLEALSDIHEDYGIGVRERELFGYALAFGALEALAMQIDAARSPATNVAPGDDEGAA